jgi:transposase
LISDNYKSPRIDSYKIALLAQGGMFPLAYVYPREKRALRDLLRRRLTFVRLRSDLLAHLHLLNYQENDNPLGRIANRKSTRIGVPEQFDNLEVRKSAEANLQMIGYYDKVIKDMEQHIMAKARKLYQKELSILMSIRGIGKTIALTLLFEMDRVDRFPSHREFASYGRLIKCTHESAGKKYGTGGAKIGNPYLKYASPRRQFMLPFSIPAS